MIPLGPDKFSFSLNRELGENARIMKLGKALTIISTPGYSIPTFEGWDKLE